MSDMIFKMLLALAVILALILMVTWIFVTFILKDDQFFKFRWRAQEKQSKNQDIVRLKQVLPLDTKRRLIVIERQGFYHLILLSPHGDKVIDGGPLSSVQASTSKVSCL